MQTTSRLSWGFASPIAALLLLLLSGFIALPTPFAEACTTILVGHEATADGSLIIARNEDNTSASDAQNIVRHAPRNEAFTFMANDNDFTWPMPPNGLGYVAFPKWQSEDQKELSFEETGINDYGIAISATETIFNSDAILAIDPYVTDTGLTEDSITSVVLPYATSAREGIRLLGRIIETAGAGEGFGVGPQRPQRDLVSGDRLRPSLAGPAPPGGHVFRFRQPGALPVR